MFYEKMIDTKKLKTSDSQLRDSENKLETETFS